MSDKTIKAEAETILAWLLGGAKQWAKACNYAEPPPEISNQADFYCCDKK